MICVDEEILNAEVAEDAEEDEGGGFAFCECFHGLCPGKKSSSHNRN